MKKRIQAFGLVFLTAAIIFFAFQNTEPPVEVHFLIWEFYVSVSLLVLGPLLAGLLIGAGTAVFMKARGRVAARKTRKDAPADSEKEALEPGAEAHVPEMKDEEEIGA